MHLPRHFIILLILCLGGAARSPAAEPAAREFTRTIYLVRHGAYDTSVTGDQEKVNGLTPLGLAQARLVAARLRGLPVDFDLLVSSTLTRARQTADVINQSLPMLTHETTRLLCECLPRTRDEASMQQAGSEEVEAAEKQLGEAFGQYFVPATDHDCHDILVCHGNVIRFLVTKALGVDTTAWPTLNVAHCSLTVIQISADGTCRILAVGDTGHLPANLTSGYSRTVPELVAP